MDLPLVVLLIPGPLAGFRHREQAEELLASPHVVAVEPGRVAYGRLLGLPAPLAHRMTAKLARRLRLPGPARAVVMFEPFQLPFARALLERHPGSELWYGHGGGAPESRRAQRLHLAATGEAAFTFEPTSTQNAQLRRRMAEIGIPR